MSLDPNEDGVWIIPLFAPETGMDPNDPAVKAMKKAARQLSLTLETDGGENFG